MDDSTQDRAAHTRGIEREPKASRQLEEWNLTSTSSGLVSLAWRDHDGTFQYRNLKIADLIRMADSHADLLAALEGVDVLYSELQAALPELARTRPDGMDRVQAAVGAARAALAKAKGEKP